MGEIEEHNQDAASSDTEVPVDAKPDTDAPLAEEGPEASTGAVEVALDDPAPFSGDELDDAAYGDDEETVAATAIGVDGFDETTAFDGNELDDTTYSDEEEPEAATIIAVDEPDDGAAVDGDAPDGGSTASGDARGEVATDVAVDELESLISFAGDNADNAAPPKGAGTGEGGDTRENTQGDAVVDQPGPSVESAGGTEAGAKRTGGVTGKKKKLMLPVIAGLSVMALGSIGGWMLYNRGEEAVPTETPTPVMTDRALAMDGFLIPYHREGRHYLSFSVSVEPVEKTVFHEIQMNREAIRGEIFDLMKAHIAGQVNTPTPEMVQSIVEEGLDACLATGRAGRVDITAFIFI